MIEDLRFIKIKNGWILSIIDKGMMKEHIEDVFIKNKFEMIEWIKENIKV